jgi:polysaccharide biosynthesis transport protein
MAELVTMPSSRPGAGGGPAERETPDVRAPRIPPEPADGLDLRHTLNVLKRRRGVIAGCTLLLTVLAAVIVFQLTPRYTAETEVMLDTRKRQVVDIQAVMSGLQSDVAVVRSEVEVLQSPALAGKVVKKLDLTANKLFNPRLAPPGFWERFNPVALVKDWVGEIFPAPEAPPLSPEQQRQADLDTAVQTVLGHLVIFNDGRSYIIKIRFESADPVLAAAVANTYAELYLLGQLDAKFAATKRASDWLDEHLTDLKQKVRASDEAVQFFKKSHQLTQAPNGITVSSQQLSELNSQLIIATADRAQKEANLRQVQEMMRNQNSADSASQVLASPVIQKLKEQQSQLRRQEAELSTRYRPAHPAMINIRAELADLNKKISEEVGSIIRGVSNEVTAARTRETTLRDQLQMLQKTTAQQDTDQVEMRELERQAEANRALYENFLNRFKQTTAQQDIQESDANIISAAVAPAIPSFPRKLTFIGIAFVFALICGLLVGFGLEQLDNGFRSAEQIEQLAGVSCLGIVPGMPMGRRPHDFVLQQPVSSYAEAIRSVRTALRFSNVDAPPKIVVVTSSVPEEGKSVFSVSLARSVARSGGRALLIDCDLRHPTLSGLLGEPKGADLVALFGEGADISQLIQVDDQSSLHYIPTRGGTANPQDLLGSQHMKNFLESMRARYDLIVLDAPPVLAVTDALVLSHAADATLFMIRWEKTPRPVALGALKLLQTQGRHLAGVVLTRVNVRKHAKYGYGDYGYYYGRYGDYYGKEA